MEGGTSTRRVSSVPALLEMRNISKSFSGVRVLNNVNLALNAGEVLALVGENGAGKSTLIKTLSGAIRADAGEIRFDGQPVRIDNPLDAERHGVITVYQEFNLFPYLSVAENLLFQRYPMFRGFIQWRALREQASQFLAGFGVRLPMQKPVHRLSVAEKQMLEIARALYRKARVLILDEPTAVLGGGDVDQLLDTVRSLRDHGVGVIFVSHRLNEVFALADKYVVLKDGEQVHSGVIRETTPDDLVAKMVGRELRVGVAPKWGPDRGRELLRVEGLTRSGVLHNISFSLHEGEVLGIAGLRGAGRTELARAIFGADPKDAGRIFVRGREVTIDSPQSAVVNGVGLVPEDRGGQGLFKNLSALQNISMVKLACTKAGWIRPSAERKAAQSYVERLQVKLPHLDAPVDRLSGGNQQKIVLSKWLEAGVGIMLLDEPTRGVDVGSKAQIHDLVRSLCESGTGIIFISSELPELLAISNRILVMHGGSIAAELERHAATEETIMRYAVGGTHS